MHCYSKTFPREQAEMFFEVLEELGIVVFKNEHTPLVTGLTIRCESKEELQAAWDLFLERWNQTMFPL